MVALLGLRRSLAGMPINVNQLAAHANACADRRSSEAVSYSSPRGRAP
jgi:hypothetical protein